MSGEIVHSEMHQDMPPPKKQRSWKHIFAVILLLGGLGLVAWFALAMVAPKQVASPVAAVKTATDNVYYAVREEDLKKAAAALPPHVNVLVTGLDNRMGQNDNHADAIHLFSIFTEKGTMRITSIPRDTKCFIDSLFPDSLSHFSNARSKLGKSGYIHTVEKFLNMGKIDYWVELNFSTVMGILQLLGYKDPATALQFLRHRKSYGLGDVQRSHNQAVFMKHAIEEHFDAGTGMSGALLLTAGLQMLETNLTKEVCEGLIYKLKEHGFPNSGGITLDMQPPYKGLQDFTISPDNIDTTVSELLENTYQEGYQGRPDPSVALLEKIASAEKDTTHAAQLIRDLDGIVRQHAWLQVTDEERRDSIRTKVERLLAAAYIKTKHPEKAEALHKVLRDERALFHHPEVLAKKPARRDSTVKQ